MSADWPILMLGDVCQKITDGAHNSPKSVENGKPMASVKDLTRYGVDLSKARLIDPVEFDKLVKQGCQPEVGDVLIAKDGNSALDTVCTVDQQLDAVMLSSVAILRPDRNKLDADFLKYYFNSTQVIDYLKSNFISGAAIPRVVLKDFRRAEIKVPPLTIQKEISQKLRMLDNKIELNRQTNQTLEHIAQALFKCWFVDFEPTRAKIIAKEKGANSAIQELAAQAIICGAMTLEQLEAITQNLETTLQQAINEKLNQANQTPINTEQLKTTAALFPNALVESDGVTNSSGTNLHERSEPEGGGSGTSRLIPEGWGVSVVGDIVTRLKPKKRYTKKQVESFGNIPVFEQGSDILLGYHNEGSGFYASPEEPLFIFGDHTCVTHLACENFDISQNVIPLEGNYYPTVWVYYAIQGKQVFQEYRRHWSEFIIKEVVAPSLELAETYSELVTRLYKQKEQLVRENGILVQTRDALLPKLLSGELNVSSD